jgi:hypothetical protein
MDVAKMSLEEIRVVGLRALVRDLGPAGLIRFLQQFETGSGDYSVDRERLLPSVSVHDLAEQIRSARKPERP